MGIDEVVIKSGNKQDRKIRIGSLTKERLMFDYTKVFHSAYTKKVIALEKVIRTHENQETRRIANDTLLDLIDPRHLTKYEKNIIREITKSTTKRYKGRERKSGRAPYAIHPISGQYILSRLRLPVEFIVSEMIHDDTEEEVKIKRTSLGLEKDNLTKKEIAKLDIVTNETIRDEYIILRNDLIEATKKTPLRYRKNLEKLILYSCIILQKVTRYETDKDYLHSLDKLIDMSITSENWSFKRIFLEYELDAHKKIALSEKEKYHLIAAAFFVKLADRISNTLDTYEEQSFSVRISDNYKDVLVATALVEYINKNPGLKKNISPELYTKLIFLKDVLLDVNKQSINKIVKKIEKENINNNEFKEFKICADDERKSYKKEGGFKYVDPKKERNKLYSGKIVGLWNYIINKHEKKRSHLDNDIYEQYIASTGLYEINDEYIRDSRHTLKGLEIVRSIQLKR